MFFFKIKYRSLIVALGLGISILASAKAIDDVKSLYDQGQFQEALTKAESILKSAPRDGLANYYKGLALVALGDKDAGIAALEKAEDRGVAAAAWELANIAYDAYLIEDASAHLDAYEKTLKKGKKSVPEAAEVLRANMLMAKNMLERVEKIQIVDSIVVDSASFFKHYILSPDAGTILDGNILPPQYAALDPRMAYKPENGKEVFWGMKGNDDAVRLYSASILDDGTMESPNVMGEDLGEGGNADFPYFTSDGMTFYFANNGENSLGGYDIFMSRREGDGTVLEPQNMGMPYNSPYDDYMLVIDENVGIGWWATDRNRIPGKVTIYAFIVNESRVNYDPDDDNLAGYAFVRDIKATQNENTPSLQALLERAHVSADPTEQQPKFMLSLGNGKVYTQLSDFRNAKARQAMEQYLEREKDMQLMQAQLSTLRNAWAQGDHGIRNEIISLEKRISAAKNVLKKLRNQAISAEK